MNTICVLLFPLASPVRDPWIVSVLARTSSVNTLVPAVSLVLRAPIVMSELSVMVALSVIVITQLSADVGAPDGLQLAAALKSELLVPPEVPAPAHVFVAAEAGALARTKRAAESTTPRQP